LIEYQTPRTFRRFADEDVIWFVGPKFDKLVDAVFQASPVATDPALADRTPANRRLALAGRAFHRSMYLRVMGDDQASFAQWQKFLAEWRAGAGQQP
jgi:hypothetical protein